MGTSNPVDPASLPPSPRGTYFVAGRHYSFDYGRILTRLGKVTDTALAKEISCSAFLVGKLRRRMGIPKYDRMLAIEPYLGKVSDRALSRHFGVDRVTIVKRRRELGIPKADLKTANRDRLLRELVRRQKKELYG